MRHVLLAGIVGSAAYGLAGPDSDVDRLRVFAAPTVAFHGLQPPQESYVSSHPDVTLHEARKYCVLALGGNPTAATELMLPIRLEDPEEFRRFGDEVAGGDLEQARDMLDRYEQKFDETTTRLPEEPDSRVVEDWLLKVREAF